MEPTESSTDGEYLQRAFLYAVKLIQLSQNSLETQVGPNCPSSGAAMTDASCLLADPPVPTTTLLSLPPNSSSRSHAT